MTRRQRFALALAGFAMWALVGTYHGQMLLFWLWSHGGQ